MRLVNNGFAFCFNEASISTTGGMEIEYVKFLRQVSNIMRALTSIHGDLLSYFNISNDTDENTSRKNNSPIDRLKNSHTLAVNRAKIKNQLPLERIFGVCKTFKKITKNVGFHFFFETAHLQNVIFISIAIDIDVTIKSLYL